MDALTASIEVEVHFYDVDSINMVWHGHYVKYLEQAREAFGRQYGIAYLDVYAAGYTTPIVDMHIRYKQIAHFEDKLRVEIRYVPCRSAKII